MTKDLLSEESRLERLERRLSELLNAASALEGRFELLNQEIHRTSSLIYRMSLAEEGAKMERRQRQDEYDAIANQLARIEAMLAER